ncbi:substrate-binding domain-containing protein [Fusibacter sp. 3D3]|uniref:substrate-binding domain-containing protein n=1 Tax=Fusibacter sp. 3D3 TaxID=1048380 RepID=UPI000853EE1D|nr:substrate-binding domain-containing protein [Fusibacter sp. 3D3]GAU78826.1 hypothetical protein F3D3_3461 [Fusibacter sp. 3D3]
MKTKIIGIAIFIVIAVIAIVTIGNGGHKQNITLSGYIGGEKQGFFEDEAIQKVLKNKYGIIVDYTKAGSVEMVRYNDYENVDFLFPSSQMALEIFKREKGSLLKKSEKVFNSPIVIYSWDEVASALETESYVTKRGDTLYLSDFQGLIKGIESEKTWKDIGLSLYGKINIICTDPNKSNSGNMYLGLLSNVLNNLELVETDDVNTVGPRAKAILDKLGYMDYSSGNLFSSYIEKGMGNGPLVVGYENQLVEFALDNPDIWEKVKNRVAILYPEPTIWSEHTVIALSDHGKLLIEALQDEEIQKMAWERHGFRTGLVTSDADQEIIKTVGIPENIDSVMPLPKADVMEALMQIFEEQ